MQAPAEVAGLVVGDSGKVGEEVDWEIDGIAISPVSSTIRGERREPRHGVPREVDGVELDVRHVVDHRGGHAQLARLGRRDVFGVDQLRSVRPGGPIGWRRDADAHRAVRCDELGVRGVAQRGFHRRICGSKHEVRALREGVRHPNARVVGRPRCVQVRGGIILATGVGILRVLLAPHPPSVQRRVPPLPQARPHTVGRGDERVHRFRVHLLGRLRRGGQQISALDGDVAAAPSHRRGRGKVGRALGPRRPGRCGTSGTCGRDARRTALERREPQAAPRHQHVAPPLSEVSGRGALAYEAKCARLR